MSHGEYSIAHKDDGEFHLPAHIGKLINDCEGYLTADEKDMAECLEHEFQQGFAKSKNDLSTTDVDQHGMIMVSQQGVKLGPRCLALAKPKALKCELERFLKLGVIEASKSSWASPVVLITKIDGFFICVWTSDW